MWYTCADISLMNTDRDILVVITDRCMFSLRVMKLIAVAEASETRLVKGVRTAPAPSSERAVRG